MKNMQNYRKMRGMSLVELLIAIMLSVMMLAGAISIFMGSKETFRLGEDLSRIQEAQRYATNRFINDIAPAGFMGCAKPILFNKTKNKRESNIVSSIPVTSDLTDFSNVIIGGEGNGHNNTDTLTVHYAQVGTSIPLETESGAVRQDSDFPISASHPAYGELEDKDDIIISDCKAISAVRVEGDPSGGQLKHTGSDQDHNFGDQTQGVAGPIIYKLDAVRYEVVIVDDPDHADRQTSVLFATRLGGNREPILDGVEDFQLEYGIDTNGDRVAERYVNWAAVDGNNWELFISSIRVTLTINPGDSVTDENGVDDEFSKTSVFTVALRNHGV